MFKKAKVTLLTAFLISAVAMPYSSAHAETSNNDKFEAYIQEAINDELALHNIQNFSFQSLNEKSFTNELDNKIEDETLKENIEKIKNADVTLLEFNGDGNLLSAESSKRGDISDEFIMETKAPVEMNSFETEDQISKSLISVQAAPSLPSGGIQLANNTSGDGAFHRLATPASTATTSYTGSVADDIRFPGYDIATASSYGEAGYLYTGFDGAGGYAEVGFGTASSTVGSYPTAWFPLFHGNAKYGPIKDTGPGSSTNGYWYDTSKPYTAGQTVTGYKAYYKTSDQKLTIHYLIGYSELYVVRYPDISTAGLKVKRLTTIGLPIQSPPLPQTSIFHTGWTSEANWGNFRFLTNNGTSTAYPGEISGLSDQTCLHGSKIYFLKKVISSTDRDESYWIYN
ncbi:hypothetical protein A8L34_23695 [Bacillus sp. FJAT-27264]|uniref:hypothetical protein n=1 Tax=Paenibacillus sp. (strain DSM 101736 / FJAT-27264) TaxID=1850362 RepID=UPI000807B2DD|nr:hypothetical protein [Bacillus sp. FJAT-27264]OBZ08326.1 hypothetical protein A8L34_23695 [Bacillus sp. FJAT-27264]